MLQALYLNLVPSKLLPHGVVAPEQQDHGSLGRIALCWMQKLVDSLLNCARLFWGYNHSRVTESGHGDNAIHFGPARLEYQKGAAARTYVCHAAYVY